MIRFRRAAATALREWGEPEAARGQFEAALNLQRQLLVLHPTRVDQQRLADLLVAWANWLEPVSKPEELVAPLDEAWKLCQKLLEPAGSAGLDRADLVQRQINTGLKLCQVLKKLGRGDDAAAVAGGVEVHGCLPVIPAAP